MAETTDSVAFRGGASTKHTLSRCRRVMIDERHVRQPRKFRRFAEAGTVFQWLRLW
jgi:hypothetical protein